MRARQHVRKTHEGCNESPCYTCELFCCKVCGTFEGGLATECPGRKVTQEEVDRTYKAVIDFRNNQWVPLTRCQ